jgi:hypothetical protein
VTLDRDDDCGADEQHELSGFEAHQAEVAREQQRQHPQGGERKAREQDRIDGARIRLAPRDQSARDLDQAGKECSRDHQLDGREEARGPHEPGEPEIEGVADEGRNGRMDAVVKPVKGGAERAQRLPAPNGHEIKRHQREIDFAQAGPHASLP